MSEQVKMDANGLLQDWVKGGVPIEEQRGRIRALLGMASPLLMAVAEQVGKAGADDKRMGMHRLVDLLRGLEAKDQEFYIRRVSKTAGAGVAELRGMLKIASQNGHKKGGDEEDEGEGIVTTGGFIGAPGAETLLELMYNEERGRTMFAVRHPDGRMEEAERAIIGGRKYLPFPANSLISKHVVLLPSELPEHAPSEPELLAMINSHLNKYFDFGTDEFFEQISTFYVLFTWLFDAFGTVVYLRALGDYGTGKSRLLRTMGKICYRPIYTTAGSSASSLFRTLDVFHGTLVLDEGDFNNSDEATMIAKILNGGNERGAPIMRTEKDAGGQFDVEAYDVYGPKIIGMRKDFTDRAIESRCLTKEMVPTVPHPRIPQDLPIAFEAECTEIRNNLLAYRLREAQPRREVDYGLTDRTLEPRLNQVTLSLMTVIKDEGLRAKIGAFMRHYNEQMRTERYETKTARIMEGIMRAWAWGPASEFAGDLSRVYMKDIAAATNEVTDEMNRRMGDEDAEEIDQRTGKKRPTKMTSRGVTTTMRKYLQLRTMRATDGSSDYKGTMYFDMDAEDERVRALCERWGVKWLEPGTQTRPVVRKVDLNGPEPGNVREEREKWNQAGMGAGESGK